MSLFTNVKEWTVVLCRNCSLVQVANLIISEVCFPHRDEWLTDRLTESVFVACADHLHFSRTERLQVQKSGSPVHV